MRYVMIRAALMFLFFNSISFAQFYVKGNLDMGGKFELSYQGESEDVDVKNGINIGAEFLSRTKPIAFGGGAEIQIPRALKGSSEKFNFIPIYGTIRARLSTDENHPYLAARMGYNLFQANSKFTGGGELDLSGGLYTAFGIGFETKMMFVELGYSINNGGVEFFGEELDAEYSRLTIGLGVKLN